MSDPYGGYSPPPPPEQPPPPPGGSWPPPPQSAPPSQPSYTPAGAGYGPPPAYSQPYGYGVPTYYVPQQTDGNAIAALVCAIVGFFACPIILSIVALVLAAQSKRRIEESGGALGGEGMVTAAKVMGWIGIGVWGVFLVFYIGIFVLAIGLGSTSSGGTSTEFDEFMRALPALAP